MFAKEFSKMLGVQHSATWVHAHNQAVQQINGLDAGSPRLGFRNVYAAMSGTRNLALIELPFHAAEKYCAQQSELWQLYQVFLAKFPQVDLRRTIFNQAKEILLQTPDNARPLDQSFLLGTGVIQKMLDHLLDVEVFYKDATQAAAQPGPIEPIPEKVIVVPKPIALLPINSDGFRVTFVLHENTVVSVAQQSWQSFLTESQDVRIITLGNEAQATETVGMADPIAFKPGGGMKQGRCLWVKNVDLLKTEITQFMQNQSGFALGKARCLFVSKSGKPSSLLNIDDIIDETAILDEFIKANQHT